MITTRKHMQFCMLACEKCNVFASLTKMRMKSERTEFEFLENREIAKHGAIRIIIKRKEGEVRKDKTKIKYLKEEKQ